MMGIKRNGEQASLKSFLRAHIRNLALLGILLLFLYAVVPQVAGFSQSVGVIVQADVGYIIVAFICWCTIYLLAAVMYTILSLKPLIFWRTLAAQFASGFTGKLLPSGLGVVGLFVQYLRRYGHSLGEAVAVAGLNNAVAIVGHIILLAGFFLTGTALPDLDTAKLLPSGSTIGIVMIVILLIGIAGIIIRKRLASGWRSIIKTVGIYRHHPSKVAAATLVSIPQTFAYVGVLYASALALGVHLDFDIIFMVATFSMLVGTLIPVPGGIVGAEAGLTAGFVAYGLTFQQGLAIALLYRAFIYWLPIIPGILVFVFRRRDYL
jgi:glycosyltransferase 2 family protein